jgi:autotransporter-associated beta strand protein
MKIASQRTRIWRLTLATIAGFAVWETDSARAQSPYSVVSWYDEFDGTSIDPSRWSFQLGTGSQYGLDGWGNNELQYYTARTSNARVADGLLTITARRESYGGQAYTSARLTTQNQFNQTGGRFEMRAALPLGQGLWPAFWMLPATSSYGGWAASGEIDILEARGQNPGEVVNTIHFGGRWPENSYQGSTYRLPNGGSIADFHTYAVEWDLAPTPQLRWYVDDRLTWRTTDWWSTGGAYPAPFDAPFHLLLNLAVGGNFVGSPDGTTPFPASMQVDYVRAYEAAPSDIVIDVAAGANRSQLAAGYGRILTADSVSKTGAGELIFDTANPYSGTTVVAQGRLRVTAAEAVAASPVRVNAGATLAAEVGAALTAPSVTLAGGTLEATALAIKTTGIRRLVVESGRIAGLPAVDVGPGGLLQLSSTSRVTMEAGRLSVTEAFGGGLVDLGAGELRIAAGGITAANLRVDILAGRNGGSWNGTAGITSSIARASAGGARTVGYLVSAAGNATVSLAAPGDTNLDGQVNIFDLVSINGAGTYGTGQPAVWSEGDFTYDGVTDIFDLVAIGGGDAYGRGNYFPQAAAGTAAAAVPEPAFYSVFSSVFWLFAALLAGRPKTV